VGEPSPPDKPRALARRVERLGTVGRFDPESVLLEKASVAHALRVLARELARAAA
jgi:hypothetical protein